MKYTGFRYQHQFYNGIATAYCSECNMNCLYCYSQNKRNKGRDYDAQTVAEKLVKICHDREIKQCRISGGEATIDPEHIVEVITHVQNLDPEILFLLETNGLVIGSDKKLLKALSILAKTGKLLVRVSIKHHVPEWFGALTGRPNSDCELPMRAVEKLVQMGVDVQVAVMLDWFGDYDVDSIIEWLLDIGAVKVSEEASDEELIEAVERTLDEETFRRYTGVMPKDEIWRRMFAAETKKRKNKG